MSGRSSSLARYLVGRAARKAPPGLAARLEEEWLADLVARRGAFARILFGLGCCWATRVIAREFGVAAASAAGGAPSSHSLLVGYGGHDLSDFSRRTPERPLPLRPTAITVTPAPQPVGPGQLPPQPVNRVLGGPGAGFPDTAYYYPPAARRMGEAGASVVSVCVDPRGRLTAAPAIVTSSGIGQIDAGALRLAKAGSGHYRPTTENGRPLSSSCYAFRIRFRLEDQ